MTTTVQINTNLQDGSPPFVNGVTVGDVAQKHVLRNFNPSGDQRVDLTKVLCAALIQQMIDLREAPDANAPTKRAASIAITQCEALQMQAVKANFVQA
ncbi:MAG TPA: hypothetical protein VN579_04455 [Bryobacteraceae bacterium]|nr:hypothetical protein [Bryobacteraceae bacterium]